MNANDEIVKKRKIKVANVVFLFCAALNLAFGVHAFIIYRHVTSELVQVGEKLNQTGVNALEQMEKDFTVAILAISIVLIGNAILMVWFFILKTKSKNNL
ncbi:MAG TPA: hypothetical protein VHG89_01325 [Verrucomicrobiae bacterium]|nr:hypothetical protein [Verrucomicrobiae bacterium]